MANRHVIHQVIHNNATTLHLASPVQQQQSLFSGQTYVAQFDIFQSPTINLGDSISIRAVDAETGTYTYQFSGTINRIAAAHFPHQVTVYCSGPLSKLRRARRGADVNMSGFTDQEAVQSVLTYCGVAHSLSDIHGMGMVLGNIEPVYFKKGQTGAEFISSIDEALGLMTIEVNNGRVVRFPYSLVPNDYSSPYTTYSGNDTNVRIYANQRDYGNLDAVSNMVEVTGVSFECGAEDECNCTLIGTADADNPLLPAGVRTSPLGMSSEFLQSEHAVTTTTQRLMRWHNRVEDKLTIEAPNDTRVWPGRPVDVIDSEYGIDLDTATRYIVTDVQRNGDIMTMNLTGGAAGAVANLSYQNLMECNDEESDGPPVEEEDFVEPIDIPPVTDFVVCPDEEVDPEPPDTTSRFLDCTERTGMDGGGIVPVDEVNTIDWAFITDASWRLHQSNDSNVSSGVGAKMDADGNIEEILVWNTNLGRQWDTNDEGGSNASRDTDNDTLFGPAPVLTVAGSVWFNDEGQTFTVTLPGAGDAATVTLYAEPGNHINGPGQQGNHYWAVSAGTENLGPISSDLREPNIPDYSCPHLTLNCNSGGRMGKDMPLALGEWHDFSIIFDLSNLLQRIDVSVGAVSGYIEDYVRWGTGGLIGYTNFDNEQCILSHPVRFAVGGVIGEEWTRTNPAMRIKMTTIGHTTCVPNPLYGTVPEVPEEGIDTVPCLPAEAVVDPAPGV